MEHKINNLMTDSAKDLRKALADAKWVANLAKHSAQLFAESAQMDARAYKRFGKIICVHTNTATIDARMINGSLVRRYKDMHVVKADGTITRVEWSKQGWYLNKNELLEVNNNLKLCDIPQFIPLVKDSCWEILLKKNKDDHLTLQWFIQNCCSCEPVFVYQ